MESKWYFFPGQTVENTKISDRAHALHITRAAWENITQHLDRKKRIQEAIDKEHAHKKALKDGSQAMTKEWKDSVENIRLRQEEDRRKRFIDHKKDDRIALFYKMKAEQEETRKKVVERIKREIFQSSGHPKEVTSALILSETLHERDEQIKFDAAIRQREEEISKKFAEGILAKDEKERKEDLEEKQKRFERSKNIAQILREQIKERETEASLENRRNIEEETADRIKAAHEEEILKQHEIDEKARLKHEILVEKRRAVEAEKIRQQKLKREEEEFEKAVQFYSDAKQRIECMKKMKEKQMRDEAIARHEEAANKVAIIKMSNEAAENERIARIVAEKDALEHAKEEEKRASQEKARQDRIDDRREHLERLEKEKHIDSEMERWEMLNRIKTAEVMKEYDEQNRKEKWEKKVQYRKELLEQMAAERQIKLDEKEIDEIMSRISFEEADRMFFEYANEVLESAKNKKRLTYPIETVIMEYKKKNSLLSKNDKRHRCQKHC